MVLSSQYRYGLKHFKLGLCIECPNKALAGKLKCAECTEKQNIRNMKNNKISKQRYIDEGRCYMCSAPLDENEGRTCCNCTGTHQRLGDMRKYAVESKEAV
jgi:hypothetical protein